MRNDALVFDVNETLLDVTALAPRFAAAFPDRDLLPEWFGLLLRYSLEVTVTGDYRPFDELAVGALVTTAARAETPISGQEARALVDGMVDLPAHPDVPEGLAMLREAGFRLATLTNSRTEVVRSQLANAGIISHFDEVLSVETVRRFKPHPNTYRHAAEALGLPVDRMTMIAAHDWDVNGAVLVGASAAFIERTGASRASHDLIPDTTATDLVTLAQALIARDRPR
jgi:2-haloacid dehalogenase